MRLSPLFPSPLVEWPPGISPTIELQADGLVLGQATRLVRLAKGGHQSGRLAVAADRDRCLALLSILARRPVASEILDHFEAAAAHWQRGDRALANLRLVFSGLPKLNAPIDAYRLRAAEYLLDEGMAPRDLMNELGLDASALGLGKYDPDQPRVPAGGGRESGRWTDDADMAETPRASEPSRIILAADQTTPAGVIYDGKIQGQMKSRGFTPEQIDEAVKFGTRIDAINKATGGPAIRYVNPTTGQSVVIDSTTNQVVQVGRSDFKFGPGGGDVPGVTMRPAPTVPPPAMASPPATAPVIEEPVIVPDVIIPP